jgi:hypothetical protein
MKAIGNTRAASAISAPRSLLTVSLITGAALPSKNRSQQEPLHWIFPQLAGRVNEWAQWVVSSFEMIGNFSTQALYG